jgi:O-antigen ligase
MGYIVRLVFEFSGAAVICYPDKMEGINTLSEKALFWSLLAMFFFIPIATSPNVICGLVVIFVWVFTGEFWRKRSRWLGQEWTLPVVIFMLLPWVGLLWTNDLHAGLVFCGKSYYWLLAFAVASLDVDMEKSSRLIEAFLLGLITSFFIAVLQFARILPMGEAGTPTSHVFHITYSLLLVFGILAASFYYRQAAGRRRKAFFILVVLAFVLNLLVTNGRSGYVAFVLLSPLFVWNITGGRQKQLIGSFLVLLALVALLFSSPMVRERMRDAASDLRLYRTGISNTSLGLRFYFWRGALEIFKSHPVLGVGTGGYKKAMDAFRTDPSLPEAVQPHNSFLYATVSFGLVGLAALLWLFYVFLKKGWQARAGSGGFAVLAFGLVLVIGSFTDTQILSVATAIPFAALMGLHVRKEKNL